MLFDTDILIWVQRGNEKAALLIEKDNDRQLSIQSYMELIQGAKNKSQHKYVKNFISEFEFTVLPLTENIGHRALIYVEEHSLASNMRSGDAIIAATAIENDMTLVSSNAKHFKVINELQLKVFKP
ncbi:MAG: type II toxin-antitoxin system VapC family toxin [Candidatus Marinimicrobia bacterium]|nr:type II toxin-antitoxin system VapC family toxin [Candidatus Neomarinimicrobiota bacterium]